MSFKDYINDKTIKSLLTETRWWADFKEEECFILEAGEKKYKCFKTNESHPHSPAYVLEARNGARYALFRATEGAFHCIRMKKGKKNLIKQTKGVFKEKEGKLLFELIGIPNDAIDVTNRPEVLDQIKKDSSKLNNVFFRMRDTKNVPRLLSFIIDNATGKNSRNIVDFIKSAERGEKQEYNKLQNSIAKDILANKFTVGNYIISWNDTEDTLEIGTPITSNASQDALVVEYANIDQIAGGKADHFSLQDIAASHGLDVEVLRKELNIGIRHELEHTKDLITAMEIAKDHLFENPTYYSDLKKANISELKKKV